MDLLRRHHPAVAIVAAALPHHSGLRVVARVRREHSETRCVVLSVHKDPVHARVAFAAGAHGYVLERSIDHALLSAIRNARDDRHYIDATLAADVSTPSGRAGVLTLSVRERQVLRRVALGQTSTAIAGELRLSPKSVESYRSRIREKLGLHGRPDMVRYALELGLVGPTTANDIPAWTDDGV